MSIVYAFLLPLNYIYIVTTKLNGSEILREKIPTDRPMPEKQGRVRRNKNIFSVGPNF